MKDRFLELSHISKAFETPTGPAVIVKDFTVRIREGEFVCIIGHSGCGKSTVLSIVMGLQEPTEGGAILDGKELTGPGTDRGVVFQSPTLLPWLTARENVLLALDQVSKRLPGRERLQLHFRFQCEGARDADALSHPGGQFFWVTIRHVN